MPDFDFHTLYIKNMVCPRCIKTVTRCLTALGLHPQSVELGTATLAEEPNDEQRQYIREALEAEGFELLENPRTQLAEQLKDAIIERVHYRDKMPNVNLSEYLSVRFHRDYSTLSKVFSEETGTTLEKYAIAQKIERAKELLTYGEMSLGEIADLLGYSSIAYLSTQFKNVTGMTPAAFKKDMAARRKPLDAI